jgi:hypothetical protein
MAPVDPPKGGLFGIDIFPGIDIQDFIPKPVADAISGTVERIISPDTDVSIGDPQPPDRPIPVDAGSEELNGAVKAIDALVAVLNTALRLKWLIPNQYEDLLGKLVGALGTIRSWLD